MPKELSEEELLDILGSRTRRKILFLLSQRPRFISELAEVLNIQRKAVIDHLSLLEKYGLVECVEKRIEKGRPRKYYEINRGFFLKIVLTRNSMVVEEIREKGYSNEIKKLEKEIERLGKEGGEDTRLAASYIAGKIEKRLREIEREWVAFQKLLEKVKKHFLI